MHGLQKDYEEDGSLSFSIKYENGVYVPRLMATQIQRSS